MRYLLFYLLFVCEQSFCQQQVAGVVINGDDNTKLASASVFINNSSKGTTSDGDGKFLITGLSETRFELVVSYSGYVTGSINITPENIKDYHTIKIYPRKKELEEINISAPEKDGWQKWGRFFTESFLGTSDFAKLCTIKNPEVIRFNNNKKTSQLHAYSNATLIIYNEALGYNIKYQLEDFIYDFKKKIISYIGYTGFEDISLKNKHRFKRCEKNRREAYEGSLQHFMRALYHNNVNEEGFVLREKIKIFPADSIFNRIYNPGNTPKYLRDGNKVYLVKLAPVKAFDKIPEFIELIDTSLFLLKDAITFDPKKKQKTFYFQDYLAITYKNGIQKADYLRQNWLSPLLKLPQVSDIVLVMNELLIIEENGNYFNPVNLLSSGYIGWHKMAETLPFDYVYEK